MKKVMTISKSQRERAIDRTEKLLQELKQAVDFVGTKDAILRYISDIDCQSDYKDNPNILGDGDFACLLIEALGRRSKTPIGQWAPGIINGAMAVKRWSEQ